MAWPARVRELIALGQSTSLFLGALVLTALSLGSILVPPMIGPDRQPVYLGLVGLALLRSYFWFVALGTLITWVVKRLPGLGLPLHLLLYASTEALRTVLIGISAHDQGMIDDPELFFRVLAGSLTGLTLLGLGAVLLNDARTFRRQRAELETVRREIIHTAKTFKQELERRRHQTIGEVKQLIESALRVAITDNADGRGGDREFAAQELVKLSNQAIRPLSHSLRIVPPDVSTQVQPVTKVRLDLRLLIERATVADPIRPWILTSLAFMLLIGAVVTSVNLWQNLLALAGIVVWTLGVAELLRRVLVPLVRQQAHLLVRIVTLSMAFTCIAASPVLINLTLGHLSSTSGPSAYLYWIGFSGVVQWVVAFYAGLSSIRQDTLDQLEAGNQRLRWVKARSVAKLWADQQYLAKVIHKDVQGQLIAEAMRLQQNLSTGSPLIAALESTQRSLTEVLAKVGEPPRPISFRQQVADVNATWAGVFELTLEAKDCLLEAIDQDAETNQILNDFVAEFALNSVKHGDAKHGRISLERVEPDVIRVAVSNDGKPFDAQISHGFGLELFSRQSMNFWHSGPGVAGAMITAELAFAPE